jgi:hypothetical protein
MADPPLVEGAVKTSVAVVPEFVKLAITGAPDVVAGVAAALAADETEFPRALVATTVNV